MLLVLFQLISHVQLFATSWTVACQVLLSSTISRNLCKFMSIELAMLPNYFTLCFPFCLLPSIFPSIRVFSNESPLSISGQSTEALTSATVLPMNIQGWSPLGLIGLISLQSKWLSRVCSGTTVWKHQFFGTYSSLWSSSHTPTWPLEKL